MAGLYRINEAMELELTQIIKDISGAEEAMWDKQDAFVDDTASVQPALKDFVILNISSGPTPVTGADYCKSPTGVGEFAISMQYRFTLSINLYTNNAHLFKISRIPLLIREESIKNRLKSVGLGFMIESDPQDLSIFDETRYNLRSHIDLIFSYIETENNINLGEIETYEATGLLGDQNVDIYVNKFIEP